MDQRTLLMHQAMLSDQVRLDAYDRALSAVISPGAVVADVGAGTLPLTALALRHGAAHVYAIEADPQLVQVASRVIEANAWSDRVTLVPGDAGVVRLPRKVDVVVAELMGNLGPEEDMNRLVRLVARRSLRPGGVVVPERLVTYVVPAQLNNEGWGVWRAGLLDMRLDIVQECVAAAAQLHSFQRMPATLGEPVALVDSSARSRTVHQDQVMRLAIDRPGILHAVLGYFAATLAPDVVLSNLPSYLGCNWAVWVWPLRHTPVDEGDVVRARVRLPAGKRVVTDWRLDCQLVRGGVRPEGVGRVEQGDT